MGVSGGHVIFSILWFYLISLCALLLFSKGFLLKRVVVSNISVCERNHWLVNNLWNGVTKNIRLDFGHHTNKLEQETRCDNLIKPRFKKAVLVVIDGLRYDFLTYDEGLDLTKVLPFQNKMSKLHKILKEQPNNGKLFKFEADPPTTTMQRIKGITTGSLPTFIDAGTNFNSYEITEDNILSQALKQGKNISFMGCSTWTELYPNHFNRKIPFSALNVKDLDTIDYGIMKNLIPELKRNDWSLMIAHFLGVDHCGHRYGTHHPEMTRKLTEMDNVISGLTETIDEETIVFVMGDHGMTRSGDHGGDSKDEVMAGLFVYSKKELFSSTQSPSTDLPQVSQIDMVPTLSMMLDQPIPFSNLGTVIPQFFIGPKTTDYLPAFLSSSLYETALDKEKIELISKLFQQITAAYSSYLNCKQLFRFMDEYQLLSKDLPAAQIDIAKESFEFLAEKFEEYLEEVISFDWHNNTSLKTSQIEESIQDFNGVEKSLQDILNNMKATCRSVWAKFDVVSITMGLTLMVFIACITLLSLFVAKLTPAISGSKLWAFVYVLSVVLCALGTVASLVQYSGDAETDSWIAFISISFSFSLWLISSNVVPSLLSFRYVLTLSNVKKLCKSYHFIFAAFIVAQSFSVFANSYIIHEDTVTLFICQTMVLVSLCGCFLTFLRELKTSNIHKRPPLKMKAFTFLRTKFVQYLFVIDNQKLLGGYIATLVLLRITKNFWYCREMQLKCSLSSYALPLVSLLSEFTEGQAHERLLVAFVSMFLIVFLTRYYFKKQGNLNAESPITYIVRVVVVVMMLAILSHWCFQLMLTHRITQLINVQSIQQIILPRVVYVIFVLSLMALVWNPQSVYSKETHRNSISTVPQIFQQMRQEMSNTSNNEKPVTVYGLRTVYSSAIMTLLFLLFMVTCMVMTDGMMAPLCCLWFAATFVSRQFSLDRKTCVPAKMLSSMVCWIYFMWYGFYGSGHQTTLPAVRYHAAYIGFKGSIPEIVPQVMVILLNTYAAQILCCLALPLLLISQPGSFQSTTVTSKSSGREDEGDGEVDILENRERTWSDLYQIFVIFIALLLFRTSISAASAAHHRRHLMVWKIFAPRFMFEAVAYLICTPMLCLSLLFFNRTDKCLRTWVHQLQQIT